MANLRDLLFGYGEGEKIEPGDFAVFDTNVDSGSNGGRCCLWTVPPGVSRAVFEIWSGGGGGGFGQCCQQGGAAGSGGYAIKSCSVSPGQQFRICAASSTSCSSSNSGTGGNDSWVCSLGGGGESTWCASVQGGYETNQPVCCFAFGDCYTCCASCYCKGGCGRGCNVDLCIFGTTGGARRTQYCIDDGHQYAGNAPFIPGPKIGPNGCCSWGGSCGTGTFPGGGGLSAQIYGGNCCCGGPGAGGLVYVLFY